ncbi:MAG: hypothetical protein JF597_49220 [Streptomyces sp.]|uniref:MoaF-related domain-containing protein n=1 Tax=Streptomyces sp. TaxID=1931 RepID=UPI0025F527D2|nr:hypothetical protein [Streptomyces sp.]MBW8801253.1 hypothetical protein [Streptomyces sp.]
MTFEVVDGAGLAADGHIETGDVQIAEIRPDVFLASWQEADGTTVVHVADLSRQRVDATIALDDRLFTPVGTFTALPGSNKHSPNLPNSTDGLRAAVPGLVRFEWNPERIFQDGDYVIAHSRTSG